MTPRPPESTGKLDSAETNPLPNVSSAHAWTALETQTSQSPRPRLRPRSPSVSVAPLTSGLTLPKAAPVIREKATAPRAPRRIRVDGTEEICADDIMVIVPRASAPAIRAKQPSSEELADDDILVEHADAVIAAPEPFRPPAFSVHATQEILADDVLDVQNVVIQDERPSTVPPPWTVDAVDDFEFAFPGPPQYSGPYPAASAGVRITNFSATQVFRRRSANVKFVIASLSFAAAVVAVAGIARLAPTGVASEGPVGISLHAPKKLDASVRHRALAYGTAPRFDDAVTISIDSLPSSGSRRHR